MGFVSQKPVGHVEDLEPGWWTCAVNPAVLPASVGVFAIFCCQHLKNGLDPGIPLAFLMHFAQGRGNRCSGTFTVVVACGLLKLKQEIFQQRFWNCWQGLWPVACHLSGENLSLQHSYFLCLHCALLPFLQSSESIRDEVGAVPISQVRKL